MFRYMTERLKEAEKKESMCLSCRCQQHIILLTKRLKVTKKHIDLTVQEKLRLRKLAADEELNEVMSTLYYSNDQLGRFISWVKSETLGSHTIVAVTGDHNMGDRLSRASRVSTWPCCAILYLRSSELPT
jgi:hypothetical protein